jgi:uncharacterized protein (UPF0147 family)
VDDEADDKADDEVDDEVDDDRRSDWEKFYDEIFYFPSHPDRKNNFIKFIKINPDKLKMFILKEFEEGKIATSVQLLKDIGNDISLPLNITKDLLSAGITLFTHEESEVPSSDFYKFLGYLNKITSEEDRDALNVFLNDTITNLLLNQGSQDLIFHLIFKILGIQNLNEANVKIISDILKDFNSTFNMQNRWQHGLITILVDKFVDDSKKILRQCSSSSCIPISSPLREVFQTIADQMKVVKVLIGKESLMVCHDFGLFSFLEQGLRLENPASFGSLRSIQEKIQSSRSASNKSLIIIDQIKKFLRKAPPPVANALVLYEMRNRIVHTSFAPSFLEEKSQGSSPVYSKLGSEPEIWEHHTCYIPSLYTGTIPSYYILEETVTYEQVIKFIQEFLLKNP